jgi:hypothetical protein
MLGCLHFTNVLSTFKLFQYLTVKVHHMISGELNSPHGVVFVLFRLMLWETNQIVFDCWGCVGMHSKTIKTNKDHCWLEFSGFKAEKLTHLISVCSIVAFLFPHKTNAGCLALALLSPLSWGCVWSLGSASHWPPFPFSGSSVREGWLTQLL